MKYFLFTILGIAILAGVWFLGQLAESPEGIQAGPPQSSETGLGGEPQQEKPKPTAAINGHVLELEVVRTPQAQSRGLSGREFLADNAGMLFIYEKPGIPGFWMPDMLISLDIIWINKEHKIVGIENNVAPETFPEIFRPPSPVMYVIEANATWAKDHGVTAGDEVLFNGVF